MGQPPSRLPSLSVQAPIWLRALIAAGGAALSMASSATAGSYSMLSATCSLRCWEVCSSKTAETGRGSRGRAWRTGLAASAFRVVRQPLRHWAGRASAPTTWSSTASRPWRPGLRNTSWPARPTRRRPNSSAVWEGSRSTCARTPCVWSDIFVTIVYGQQPSRQKSCRCFASSGRRRGLTGVNLPRRSNDLAKVIERALQTF